MLFKIRILMIIMIFSPQQAFSDLVLDNIELLFIHKNRDKLVSEAVLLNRTKVELCTDYWVDQEVWEVWRVEEGRKILNPVRTSHPADTRTPVANGLTIR